MGEIRIAEDVTPATPPSGNSTLFIDVVDNKAKQLRSDGTVIDLTAGAASGAKTTQIVNSLANLPIAVAGVISLAANTNYVLGDNLSISDRFDVSAGNISWTSNNLFGPKLTYTGGLTLFTGVDTKFNIINAALDCPNAQIFDFRDTASPGSSVIQMDSVVVDRCGKWGRFEDMLSFLIINSSCVAADQGVEILGSTWIIQSAIKFALLSGSPTFIGYDMGTSVAVNMEFIDFVMAGPPGSIAISGLPNSGNIAAGGGGALRDGNFISPITPTGGGFDPTNDVRWSASSNTDIKDTSPDALIFSRVQATNPTGSVATGVPVAVNSVFTEERSSFFTTNAGGEITYIGETPRTLEVDIVSQVAPVSGSNRDITVYVAVDSGSGYVVDINSGFQVAADSGNPQTSPVIWQVDVEEGDRIRAFISNDTLSADTNTNTITIRVR